MSVTLPLLLSSLFLCCWQNLNAQTDPIHFSFHFFLSRLI